MQISDLAFAWDDSMSLGIEVIDNQHKHFVELLADLYKCLQTSASKEEVQPIIDELVKYTIYHFQTEEDLFDRSGYLGGEEHKKVHAELKANVAKFVEAYANGGTVELMNLIDFLEDWLIQHLTVYDKEYAPFIIAFLENNS